MSTPENLKHTGKHAEVTRQRGKKKENVPPDAKPDMLETIAAFLAGYACGAVILWLFYRHIFVFFAAAAAGPAGIKVAGKIKARRVQAQIKNRFTDVLGVLSAATEAGETPEHAFVTGFRELAAMYPAGDPVLRELAEMVRRMNMNGTVEEALSCFALNMGDEDIKRFAEVFSLTKRRGGDLLSVIRSSERTASEKEEVKKEIITLITAKRLEAAVMAVMPPAMILYFLIADPAFLKPLYSGSGRLVMTALLGVYAVCVYLTIRITDIEV